MRIFLCATVIIFHLLPFLVFGSEAAHLDKEGQHQVLRRLRQPFYGGKNNEAIKHVDTTLEVEDDLFMERLLQDMSMSSATKCKPDCPCCSTEEWPEFVAAIDRYTGPPDSCFFRQDTTSRITALDLCEIGDFGGFESGLTAYMSFDYENRGGTASDPVFYCGGSSSAVNFVSETEGAACESLIENRVAEEGGVCNDVFECV